MWDVGWGGAEEVVLETGRRFLLQMAIFQEQAVSIISMKTQHWTGRKWAGTSFDHCIKHVPCIWPFKVGNPFINWNWNHKGILLKRRKHHMSDFCGKAANNSKSSCGTINWQVTLESFNLTNHHPHRSTRLHKERQSTTLKLGKNTVRRPCSHVSSNMNYGVGSQNKN